MGVWDPSTNSYDHGRTEDRWSRPCTRCAGSGSVLRNEKQSCGCITRCSAFCSRTYSTTVSSSCTHCNGRGVEPY